MNRFVKYLNTSRRSLKGSAVVTPNVSYKQFFRAPEDSVTDDIELSFTLQAADSLTCDFCGADIF